VASWNRLQRALTSSGAATAPDTLDRRLRGRTYAVPFDEVWQCALRLADGGLRGWCLLEADDVEGILHGTQRGLLRRAERPVTVRIGFDADAQTRVDLEIASAQGGGPDLGAAARAIHRFTAALDRELHRRRRATARPAPIRLDT